MWGKCSIFTPEKMKRQSEWLAADDVALILLHRPGRAGSLSEQVELRSTAAIAAWRQREELDLVYDNGQSFVLSRISAPVAGPVTAPEPQESTDK